MNEVIRGVACNHLSKTKRDGGHNSQPSLNLTSRVFFEVRVLKLSIWSGACDVKSEKV